MLAKQRDDLFRKTKHYPAKFVRLNPHRGLG